MRELGHGAGSHGQEREGFVLVPADEQAIKKKWRIETLQWDSVELEPLEKLDSPTGRDDGALQIEMPGGVRRWDPDRQPTRCNSRSQD
jgi:hypothetical protein